METIEIEMPEGVYVVRKSFVDEVYKMRNSRFNLFGKRFKISDEMILDLALEENMVIERKDKV